MSQIRSRLIIADDNTLFSEGIGKLLEGQVEVVATATDAAAVLDAARRLRPDVVLLDFSTPFLDGVEVCRELLDMLPRVRVLFLNMPPDDISGAMRAGGSGYLLRTASAPELRNAISAVLRGDHYMPNVDLRQDPSSLDHWATNYALLAKLTRRQREVLMLLAEGKSNRGIAVALGLTEKTVEFHKASLKRGLRLKSTATLTQFAIRSKLVGF